MANDPWVYPKQRRSFLRIALAGGGAGILAALGMGTLAALDSAETPPPPTNPATADLAYTPGRLYVLDATVPAGAGLGVIIALQALQGLVNRTAPPQIFLSSNDDGRHDADWLQLLAADKRIDPAPQPDLRWYIRAFRSVLQGFVLFDQRRPESINVALSLAGLLDAIAVDARDAWLLELLAELKVPQLADLRERNTNWLIASEYWPRFNKAGIVQLNPFAGIPSMRDFGVAQRMAFFFNDTPRDPQFTLMQRAIADLPSGAAVYGWGYADGTFDEGGFIAVASRAGLSAVPADLSGNLSVWMHLPPAGGDTAALPATPAEALPARRDVHYVAFIVSDGDNTQVALNRLTDPQADLFRSPQRGTLPIGWTIPPALAEVAPAALDWIVRALTPNDTLIAGPAGAGYVFPSLMPDRAAWAQQTAAALERSGIRSIVSLDYNREQPGFSNAVLDPLMASPAIDGAFFAAYDWSDPPLGSILWSHNKPVFSTTRLGYAKPAREELQSLADELNRRPRDPARAEGYSAVYAHLWGTTVADLAALTELLDPQVVLVTPDVLIRLARENIEPRTEN